MSTIFGFRGIPSKSMRPTGSLDQDDRAGCYLTDGVTLLRYLGTVSSGMAELEDCRSLDLIWLPIGQLRDLPIVLPATDE